MRHLLIAFLAACTVDLESAVPPDDPSGGGESGESPPIDRPPLVLCTDCSIHVPASYSPGRAMPLLVALHGDEGRDFGRAVATKLVIDSWRAAADQLGWIVLAPACPESEGCNGAWSDHLAAQGYRLKPSALAWLDAQVDAVAASYNVDITREALAGYSGGAYWLGYYAQARADRFSGVAFVAGGMPAYTASNPCPARALPGYFLGGDMDFRTEQMSDTANAFVACGAEVVTDLVANSDHEATIGSLAGGKAATILSWLLARPR